MTPGDGFASRMYWEEDIFTIVASFSSRPCSSIYSWRMPFFIIPFFPLMKSLFPLTNKISFLSHLFEYKQLFIKLIFRMFLSYLFPKILSVLPSFILEVHREEFSAAGGARCLRFSPVFFEGQQVGIRRIHYYHSDLVVKRSKNSLKILFYVPDIFGLWHFQSCGIAVVLETFLKKKRNYVSK